jgi:predicted RNase H-like nuclease
VKDLSATVIPVFGHPVVSDIFCLSRFAHCKAEEKREKTKRLSQNDGLFSFFGG